MEKRNKPCKTSLFAAALLLLFAIPCIEAEYNVSLLSPEDGATIDVSRFTLNYSIGEVISNCSVYLWNSSTELYDTGNISMVNGSNSFTVQYAPNDTYEWNIYCYNATNASENASGNETNWTFTVEASPIVYVIQETLNQTQINESDVVTFRANITNIGQDNLTSIMLTHRVDSRLNFTNQSSCGNFTFQQISDWQIVTVNVTNCSGVLEPGNTTSVLLNYTANSSGQAYTSAEVSANSTSQFQGSSNYTLGVQIEPGPLFNLTNNYTNSLPMLLGEDFQFVVNITNINPDNLTEIWLRYEYNQPLNYSNQTYPECFVNDSTNEGDSKYVNINVTQCMIDHMAGKSQLAFGETFQFKFNLTGLFEAGAMTSATVSATSGSEPPENDNERLELSFMVGDGWNGGLSSFQSLISNPYIHKQGSQVLNFSLYRMAEDTNCLTNITIYLPENYSFMGYNSSTIAAEEYVFTNTSSTVTWHTTGTSFFCGQGDESFFINVSSVSGYGPAKFEVLSTPAPDGGEAGFNMTVFTTEPFNYSGTVYDLNSTPIEGAVASILAKSYSMSGEVTLGTFNSSTNSAGEFEITGIPGMNQSENIEFEKPDSEQSIFYRLSVVKYNDTGTNHYGMFVGPSLPDVPEMELKSTWGLKDPEVFLKNATTFHIRVLGKDYRSGPNNTYDGLCPDRPGQDPCPEGLDWSPDYNWTYIGFNYGLKDKKLGYEVSSDHTTSSTERWFSAPRSRNYSVMVFPESSFPIYLNFENIEDRCNTSGYNLSDTGIEANCTITNGTYYIEVVIDSTMNITRLNGTINMTDVDAFHVMAYMLGAGENIYDQDSLPFNMGQMEMYPKNDTAYDDYYNLSTGDYSINLPATAAPSSIMLIAYVEDEGNYYQSMYKLSVGNVSLGISELDFNMSQLMPGTFKELTQNNISADWNQTTVVTTTAVTFSLVYNGTPLSTDSSFIEMKLEMSNGTEYKKMTNAASGVFTVPIVAGEGIKKLTVYSQSYAPLSLPVTPAILSGSESNDKINCSIGACDINLVRFDSFDPDNPGEKPNITIEFFKSNDACNVPDPSPDCGFGGEGGVDKDSFSPLKAMLMGDVSMRITSGNISVHYVNTDLMASGPPDAAFSQNSTGSDMESAWKFGSSGPEIYDEVLISMPYPETLGSANLSVGIPVLYDSNFTAIWNSSQNSLAEIDSNDTYEDYRDYIGTQYESYLNGSSVDCNNTDENMTASLCFKDASNGTVWLKIPHFSGVGPAITGQGATSGDVNFTVTKTALNSTYHVNDTVEYVINVTNLGADNIVSVNVTDLFNSSQLNYTASNVSATSSGQGYVIWLDLTSGEALATGESVLVSVNMTALAESEASNNASVNASTVSFYDTASANVTVSIVIARSLSLALNEPENNSEGSGSTSFNFTVSGTNATYGNCSLYLNGTYNTSLSAANNTKAVFNITSLSEGAWLWNVTCWINESVYNSSSTWNYTVTTSTTTTTTTTQAPYVPPAQTTTTTTSTSSTTSTTTTTTTSSSTSTTRPPRSPIISGVAALSVTEGSAVIVWSTSLESDSLVEYGTTESYGQTESDASMALNHSVALSGLEAGAVYHYRVTSATSENGSMTSVDYTFQTLLTQVINESLGVNETNTIEVPDTNLSLDIVVDENVSNTTIVISSSTDNPVSQALSVPALGKYIQIEASQEINESLSSVMLRIYYTDEEVDALGINETSIAIYWFSGSEWVKLEDSMDWVYATGIDTENNYVWANVSHFSYYSVGGLADVCELSGDYAPCGTVSLVEMLSFLEMWLDGEASMLDVMNLMEAWLD